MHLEMIEPLRLSIVLCAKDTSVEEDKQDDEPEHGLGNKDEYKYNHDDIDGYENNEDENHDDDYEGADEDKQDDDPEHELDNNQDEN